MRTRFAPAPTGLLHLGHVANAIYVWGLAAQERGTVLLRIEDHDRQRSSPSFEQQLLDDLDWLGFSPDRYPASAYRAGHCDGRQSDRETIYRAAADALVERGLVYGCTCARRPRSAESVGSPAAYPGTCRERGLAPTDDVTWRVRLAEAGESFSDALEGPQSQSPAREFGDPAIRDRHGNWSYQFAVVVDDRQQEIDTVIRGRDLLPSTGLQIQLGRLIGRAAPARFAHHPLIMKSATRKLSKSDGDTGIASLRASGLTAPRVIALAAQRIGLAAPEELDARDVGQLFLSDAPIRG
jgi:glutamyl/glutaminyl-tRNA synthetase